MNQSNQSLQVSKNDSFSEQNQLNQNHTDNNILVAPGSVHRPYDVETFAVCTAERKILSEAYAVLEHAEQWAKEFDPDNRHELFLHSMVYFYPSEFARDRQGLLTYVIGATRGHYFVIHGGDDCIVKNRLIGPVFESQEQATAWRHLSLPFYPECQIVCYESALRDGTCPDFQLECNRLAVSHVTAFAVEFGGDGECRSLPIGDRYFTTEEQARCYQSEILSEHPTCQISPQNFHFEHVYKRQDLLERLFGHLKTENAGSAEEV
ncbi:MAG: hypothetical protein KGZ58_06045 [Ignavibacteriales bacterium]|nr:hypothetical protein [Ignavibacteriales bacterium]